MKLRRGRAAGDAVDGARYVEMMVQGRDDVLDIPSQALQDQAVGEILCGKVDGCVGDESVGCIWACTAGPGDWRDIV